MRIGGRLVKRPSKRAKCACERRIRQCGRAACASLPISLIGEKCSMAKWLARAFLRITGWQLEGVKPDAPRFVLVAAPHTSKRTTARTTPIRHRAPSPSPPPCKRGRAITRSRSSTKAGRRHAAERRRSAPPWSTRAAGARAASDAGFFPERPCNPRRRSCEHRGDSRRARRWNTRSGPGPPVATRGRGR